MLSEDKSLAAKYPDIALEFVETVDGEITDPGSIGTGSHKKAVFICARKHKWVGTVAQRVRNDSQCLWCRRGMEKFADVYPEIRKKWADDNEEDIEMVASKSGKKVRLICENHVNYPYEIKPRDYARGVGCGYCDGKQVGPFNSFEALADDTVKSEFVQVDGFPGMDEVTLKSSKIGHWKCENGHEWASMFKTRANGSGCMECYRGHVEK